MNSLLVVSPADNPPPSRVLIRSNVPVEAYVALWEGDLPQRCVFTRCISLPSWKGALLDEAEHDEQPQVHVSLSQSKTHMSDTSTVTQPIKASVWVRFNNLEQHHSSIEHVHHGHHGQEGQTRHQGSWEEWTGSYKNIKKRRNPTQGPGPRYSLCIHVCVTKNTISLVDKKSVIYKIKH